MLDQPLELRLAALAVVAVVGLLLGAAVNWAIYSLAIINPRPIGPWSGRHPKAPPRRWFDYLPVVGWLGLRREAALHGRGFWVRPLLIELVAGIGLPWLYWWEAQGGLLAARITPALVSEGALHAAFIAHTVLFALLLAATFIDFDEKMIPDEITIPGVFLGLLLTAVFPDALLPAPLLVPSANLFAAGPVWLTSSPEPSHWPFWLNTWQGLALALVGVWGWSLAMIPFIGRRGWAKGMQFFVASIGRHGAWKRLLFRAAVTGAIVAGGWFAGGRHWQAVLTSVAGIVLGGGLVWLIRIFASVALHKEALGFGDVTLMAMIGALLGWQATWIVFFLSPLAAVVVASINWLITRRRDLPFGPYLALAAAVVVVRWAGFWDDFARPIFELGWMLIAILAVCLMLMMGLLMLWRIIETAIYGDRT